QLFAICFQQHCVTVFCGCEDAVGIRQQDGLTETVASATNENPAPLSPTPALAPAPATSRPL
ncbi:MAG: hypothetical protein ACKPJD_21600, partial [Planctomycetaceae bacterium]